MPHGAGGNVHLGARRHIRFTPEVNFGEVAGIGDWVDIPYITDGFKLKATNPRYVPDTNYGGDYRRHLHICHRLELAGDFVTLPWPQVTQFLLDMALLRGADHDLNDSFVVDHFTPADPRRYTGAVAERLVISFDGTGDGAIQLRFGLRAQYEQENNALVETDFDYSALSTPFMHANAAIHIAGAPAPVTHIDSGTITIENNVAVGPYRRLAGGPFGVTDYLIAQQRTISLEFARLNNVEQVNDWIRECGYGSFQFEAFHPAGHYMHIELPVIWPSESDEDGTPSQVAKENPRFEAGVNAAGDDITYGVDLAAGGITTAAPLPEITTTTVAATTTTAAPTTTTAAL